MASNVACDWSQWTDWSNLGMTEGYDFATVPAKPGAYAIAADHELNRCVGVDSFGILTIGQSDDLQRRIRDFCGSATIPGSERHRAGLRFALFNLTRISPYARLRVRWRSTATKEEAFEIEGQMLLAYISVHCELPPLNYQFNWSAVEKHGLDSLVQKAGSDSGGGTDIPRKPNDGHVQPVRQ
jgi:hypothetical protein